MRSINLLNLRPLWRRRGHFFIFFIEDLLHLRIRSDILENRIKPKKFVEIWINKTHNRPFNISYKYFSLVRIQVFNSASWNIYLEWMVIELKAICLCKTTLTVQLYYTTFWFQILASKMHSPHKHNKNYDCEPTMVMWQQQIFMPLHWIQLHKTGIFDHHGHIAMHTQAIDSQYLRFNFLCFLHNCVYDHVAPDRDSDHTIYK